jgi:hypothetical protein
LASIIGTDCKQVGKGDNYDEHSENWDTRFDHNHLRITRIIRCLRVLGFEDEAKAFHKTLEATTMKVSYRSREFWRRAAERALNLRPDLDIYDEDDTTIGPGFLREFEIARQAKLAAAGKRTDPQDGAGSQVVDEREGEKEEKKGLFDDSEDEEAPNEREQSGLQAADERHEVQEWKGFADDENTSGKPDQSGLENLKDNEAVEEVKKDLRRTDNTATAPN